MQATTTSYRSILANPRSWPSARTKLEGLGTHEPPVCTDHRAVCHIACNDSPGGTPVRAAHRQSYVEASVPACSSIIPITLTGSRPSRAERPASTLSGRRVRRASLGAYDRAHFNTTHRRTGEMADRKPHCCWSKQQKSSQKAHNKAHNQGKPQLHIRLDLPAPMGAATAPSCQPRDRHSLITTLSHICLA
jgi:hypothetical protein